MKKYTERLYNGIIWENPTFVLMLGMCPTLAVTTSAINGIGMGLSTLVVLVCSNLLISLFRKIIPNGVRMPIYIVIVATLVTIVQFLMEAYLPSLASALGVYIPLIVVNCIILGRAESYASKHTPLLSVFDGLGMGLGFTLGLTIIGLVREILGAGTIFDQPVLTNIGYTPITIFIMAPGAFLVLAVLVALMNIVRVRMEKKGTPLPEPSGCLAGACAVCAYADACAKSKDKEEADEGPKSIQDVLTAKKAQQTEDSKIESDDSKDASDEKKVSDAAAKSDAESATDTGATKDTDEKTDTVKGGK